IRVSSTNFSAPDYSEREIVVESSKITVDIDNLMPFNSYVLDISAFNIAVPSEPTELMFPFVNADEVRITWKAPYRPNGIISRYAVSYWPNRSEIGQKGQIKTTLNADLQILTCLLSLLKTVPVMAPRGRLLCKFRDEKVISLLLISDEFIWQYRKTFLHVDTPGSPSRPINNKEKLPGPYNITIDFDHESDPYNRFFVLEYKSKDDAPWLIYPDRIPGNEKTYTVTGLMPNRRYTFRIKSVNDFGVSRPSLPSDWIKSDEFLPSEPPSDMLIKSTNSSSIEITFNAPVQSTWHSDQVGFRISYFVYNVDNLNSDSQDIQLLEVPLDGPERMKISMSIDSLKQFEHYAIFIETFNHVGSSRSSDAIFFYVGYSLPTSIVNGLKAAALSSTEVHLSWDAWSDSQELINGFKVKYT
uniref:Fibronectin type-III domain-containing protein n=1 Tax=Romanomermis culicivorax TaxID=13658 RepID=A0A915HKW8_ROMCU